MSSTYFDDVVRKLRDVRCMFTKLTEAEKVKILTLMVEILHELRDNFKSLCSTNSLKPNLHTIYKNRMVKSLPLSCDVEPQSVEEVICKTEDKLLSKKDTEINQDKTSITTNGSHENKKENQRIVFDDMNEIFTLSTKKDETRKRKQKYPQRATKRKHKEKIPATEEHMMDLSRSESTKSTDSSNTFKGPVDEKHLLKFVNRKMSSSRRLKSRMKSDISTSSNHDSHRKQSQISNNMEVKTEDTNPECFNAKSDAASNIIDSTPTMSKCTKGKGKMSYKSQARCSSSSQNLTIKKRLNNQQKKVKTRLFTCWKCDMTFTRSQSLLSHVVCHGNIPVSCRTCHVEFLSIDSMSGHTCIPVRKTKKLRKCATCGAKFIKYSQYLLHRKVSHGLKTRKHVLQKYSCQFCRVEFTRKSLLYVHLQEHSDGQSVCLGCGEFFSDSTLFRLHIQEHKGQSNFVCMKCGMKYRTGKQYDEHYRSHKSIDCNKCSEFFDSVKDLEVHYVNVHNSKLPKEDITFDCQDCSKKFLSRSLLEIHKKVHTGEKPIECTVCQLFFCSVKALTNHNRTYRHSVKIGIPGSVKKKYLCSVCGKAYFRKHALQRHMGYHSGSKPHMCQYCGYKCWEANNLKRHMVLHFEAERNFVCEICGAAFHAKKTLEMHNAYKHNETRAFACDQCNLTFKAKNALTRHLKVHSSEKEHRCWCGTAFKRMYNLRRHLQTVHGKDDILPPVRRVQTLDQATKAPISRTDLAESPVVIRRRSDIAESSTTLSGVITSHDTVRMPSVNEEKGLFKEADRMPASLTNAMPEVSNPKLHVSSGMMPESENVRYISQFIPLSSVHQDKSSQANEVHLQQLHTMQYQHSNVSPSSGISPQTQNFNIHETPNTIPTDPNINNTMVSEEVSNRIRYNSMENLYNNIPVPSVLDPNDPFNIASGTVMAPGSTNFIPQAVAYSSILREFAPQLQFLQDTTNNSNLHNYCKQV